MCKNLIWTGSLCFLDRFFWHLEDEWIGIHKIGCLHQIWMSCLHVAKSWNHSKIQTFSFNELSFTKNGCLISLRRSLCWKTWFNRLKKAVIKVYDSLHRPQFDSSKRLERSFKRLKESPMTLSWPPGPMVRQAVKKVRKSCLCAVVKNSVEIQWCWNPEKCHRSCTFNLFHILAHDGVLHHQRSRAVEETLVHD